MYETTYHKASSVEEAAKLLGDGDDPKLISGGQTLIPTMKQRLAAPSDLVDVTGIEGMKGVKVDGRKVTIGGATTHMEVATNKELQKVCPGFAKQAGSIGDAHVRHMGTIGGSIANNDPAACYPSGVLALDAEITTNKRTMPADEFFTGLYETALDEDEIVVSVSFEAPEKCAYEKFRNPASRYPMAGVFVAKSTDGGVRVAVTGAGNDGVFRHAEMETNLSSDFSPEAIADVSVDESGMLSDIHGDAAYRANLVKVMAKRAVASAH